MIWRSELWVDGWSEEIHRHDTMSYDIVMTRNNKVKHMYSWHKKAPTVA